MTNKVKNIVFTAGLPGAGKSFIIKNSEFSNLPIVDCDEFKKLHKDYDPKNPSLVHDWSVKMARHQQFEYLGQGIDFIIDGTGTNVEKYLKWFQEARELGYTITVVYVKVKLSTSIKRNEKRDRSVPVELILEKAQVINQCMNILGSIADKYQIIEND